MEKAEKIITRLFEIKRKMSELKEEEKGLSPQVIEILETAGSTKMSSSLGSITLSERISFTYSKKVDDKKEELKVLKTSEEESGDAKMSTTKYIRVLPIKKELKA